MTRRHTRIGAALPAAVLLLPLALPPIQAELFDRPDTYVNVEPGGVPNPCEGMPWLCNPCQIFPILCNPPCGGAQLNCVNLADCTEDASGCTEIDVASQKNPCQILPVACHPCGPGPCNPCALFPLLCHPPSRPSLGVHVEDLCPAAPSDSQQASCPPSLPNLEALRLAYHVDGQRQETWVSQPVLMNGLLLQTHAVLLSTTTLHAEIFVTPLATIPPLGQEEHVVGIAYRGVIFGLGLTASAGSSVRASVQIEAPGLLSGALCEARATATLSVVTGASRIPALRLGVGEHFDARDVLHLVAGFRQPIQSGDQAPVLTVDARALCGNSLDVSASLAANVFSSLSGNAGPAVLALSGDLTSASVRFEPQPFRLLVSHNSNALSGTVALGSHGTMTLQSAPRKIEASYEPADPGPPGTCGPENLQPALGRLHVAAWDAPVGGASVQYAARFRDINVNVDIKKLASATLHLDVSARSVFFESRHAEQQGALRANVSGLSVTWDAFSLVCIKLPLDLLVEGRGLERTGIALGTDLSPPITWSARLGTFGVLEGSLDATILGQPMRVGGIGLFSVLGLEYGVCYMLLMGCSDAVQDPGFEGFLWELAGEDQCVVRDPDGLPTARFCWLRAE